MKRVIVALAFAVVAFCMPVTASAETYTDTVVTGLGSGYFMPWGTFGEGMCAFSDGENYGYSANANQYNWSDTKNFGIAAFHEGRACIVGDNGKWGFIDKTGKAVTAFEFTSGTKFENGKANVHFASGCNLIDLNGNKLLPKDYDRIDKQEDGSWYCYDLTFHLDVEVGIFCGTAYDTNSYDVYDANLNYVKNVAVNKKYERPSAFDFSSTLNRYGLDKTRYSSARDIGNGLVLVELEEFDADGNHKVLIDAVTKKELPIAPFVIAEEFNDDGICVIGRCCTVNLVNYIKIGAIDAKGNLLVPFNYLGSSWAKEFNDGLLLAQRASDNKLVVVKLTGTNENNIPLKLEEK